LSVTFVISGGSALFLMSYDKKRIEQAAVAAKSAGLRLIEARAAERAKVGPSEALHALEASRKVTEVAFKDAMTELFDAAVGFSSFVVSRILSNPVHIEDCSQDIWKAMLEPEKILGFERSKGTFCGWFSRFVRWQALDFGRKLGVLEGRFVSQQDEDSDSDGEDGDRENAAFSHTDDESFLAARVGIDSEQLEDAMKELSSRERSVLVACFLKEQSHTEVGQVMGLKRDVVRAVKSQALTKLREIFRKRGWME